MLVNKTRSKIELALSIISGLFVKNAIESGLNALKNGCNIVVDVNGVVGGLNKQNPKNFGNKIETIINLYVKYNMEIYCYHLAHMYLSHMVE